VKTLFSTGGSVGVPGVDTAGRVWSPPSVGVIVTSTSAFATKWLMIAAAMPLQNGAIPSATLARSVSPTPLKAPLKIASDKPLPVTEPSSATITLPISSAIATSPSPGSSH
jgi:hypothetical protein